MDDVVQLDATAQAELVRTRAVRPDELIEAAIRRIETLNPVLNAVVATRFDEALAEAKHGLPAGPFAGVPFLVKDTFTDVAGLPSTDSSRLFADRVASRDSEVVARARIAGLVVLGKTNAPEFGKNASTEPVLFGPARNPWRRTHSTGGSSGGSAAAVAAGMAPVAHGNDAGGSIRIPAAICGLFGFKPSRGLVPAAPHAFAFSYPLGTHHGLPRSVRDSAALLDVVSGPLAGAAYAVPAHTGAYLAEVGRPPGRLRIGWTTTTVTGLPSHPECAAAAERMATLCAALQHDVEPAQLPQEVQIAHTASYAVMMAAVALVIDRRLAELGRALREDDIEPFTRFLLEQGRGISGGQIMQFLQELELAGRAVAPFFTRYDVLLTPTIPVPTPTLGTLDTARVDAMVTHAGVFTGFTGLFNVTGQPAMSIPCGFDSQGLPLGVHFAAAFGRDDLLLRLAAQIEDAAPWVRIAPCA